MSIETLITWIEGYPDDVHVSLSIDDARRLARIVRAADEMANQVVCAEERAQAVRAVRHYRKARDGE